MCVKYSFYKADRLNCLLLYSMLTSIDWSTMYESYDVEETLDFVTKKDFSRTTRRLNVGKFSFISLGT